MSDMDKSPRLFVEAPLGAGQRVTLDRAQSHYLQNVMRKGEGDVLRLFNRTDGEWSARIASARKNGVEVACLSLLRPALLPPDIDYLFAPLKSARLDYVAQKACEMGVRRLRPILTQHTVAGRVNLERLQANVVEAAEQCELTSLPQVLEPLGFDKMIAGWQAGRRLIFCDEQAAGQPALAALQAIPPDTPLALLIGPEGGFSAGERAQLIKFPGVIVLPLGPRILRADTAAVAALALVQAVIGDWR
jgi:16S rRNA (uracil1498-N3)-methyltransferase